ncbi:MAG: HAMP domain-containing histidine kinase [Chloroflexi bacterium]|nr:HAMP domain-containing histidine kinase [Chloroflexota bacterium]
MTRPRPRMPAMVRSLRGQLILSHLLVTLIGVALVAAFAGRNLVAASLAEAEHSLEDVGFVLSNELEEPLNHLVEGEDESSPADVTAILDNHLSNDYPILVVVTANGQVILPSNLSTPIPDPREAVEVRGAFAGGDLHEIRLDAAGREMLFGAVPIQHEGEIYGALQLATPMAPVREKIAGTLITLAVVIASVSIAVGGAGWWLAGQLTRPLAQLTTAAEKFAEGKLDEPVASGARAAELIRLESAFNEMARRLQKLIADQRAFVANASHELRTPLTSLKLRAEALNNGALGDAEAGPRFAAEIETEVDRLTKMVNDLLDLSRIESGIATLEREAVDLAQLAAEARDAFSVRADRAGVNVTVEVNGTPPPVSANETHLRRLLDNLLDNAVKYTAHGGAVTIRVGADSANSAVTLEVIDTGVGISPERLPHVFDRFYRGGPPLYRTGPLRAREGAGLGLSIVQSIAQAYGGSVRADSPPGRGTTIAVRLPTHPPGK